MAFAATSARPTRSSPACASTAAREARTSGPVVVSSKDDNLTKGHTRGDAVGVYKPGGHGRCRDRCGCLTSMPIDRSPAVPAPVSSLIPVADALTARRVLAGQDVPVAVWDVLSTITDGAGPAEVGHRAPAAEPVHDPPGPDRCGRRRAGRGAARLAGRLAPPPPVPPALRAVAVDGKTCRGAKTGGRHPGAPPTSPPSRAPWADASGTCCTSSITVRSHQSQRHQL